MKWILMLWIVWGGNSSHFPQPQCFPSEVACYKALGNLRIETPSSADENEWVIVALCRPDAGDGEEK